MKPFLLILAISILAIEALPGDFFDTYTKKKLSEKPKKKTHYFDKYDKKALAKGKNGPNAEVISPLEAHFEENEKIVVSENEKEKICMSIKEDTPTNFLTKLGLVTKMIDDITQFRIRMKRSRSRIHDQDQHMKSTDEGVSVEATEAIWKLKKKHDDFMTVNKKPLKLWKGHKNNLGANKKRFGTFRRNSRVKENQFPTCFGYEYFSAVDALDDNGFPDIEIFQEYFSDLSDDKLAVQLTDIVTTCVEPIEVESSSTCPEPKLTPGWLSDMREETVLGSCEENCFMDADCSENEICCPNECGGHLCLRTKPEKISKQKSLCHNADEIMKCFYENVKHKVCSEIVFSN